MSASRDPDVILAAWLDDGPATIPSSTRRAISTAVRTTPQARVGLLGPAAWRLTMSKLIVLAGAAAVVAVAIGAVAGGLPGPSGTIGASGPPPVSSPSVSPLPTPSPSAAPTPSPTPGQAFLVVDGDRATWKAMRPAGWTGGAGWYLTPNQGPEGPTGIAVAASGAVNVPIDPCDGVGKVSDAKSPADVVAELDARDDLVVSDAIDTTFGGYAALRVDVDLPADLVSVCGEDSYILFAEPDGNGIHAMGPSNHFRLWIVDVEGRPVVFWIESFPGTPANDLAAAQQIADSIVIAP